MTFATRSPSIRSLAHPAHAALADAMPAGLQNALAALPVLEALESRQLLAASQAGSIITLSGNASSANTFDVKISSGKLATTVNGATTSFTNASGLTLKINGGSANDKVTISDAVTAKAYVDVGAGNDSVRAGGGSDTVYAGAGNDSVNGGLGTDVAYDAESVSGATSLKSTTTTPPVVIPPVTPTTSSGGGKVTQSGSTITITGLTGSANTVDVKILSGKLAATLNGATTSFTNSSGLTLKITGGSGNDKVTISDAVTAKAYVDVGAGNDSVKTGSGNDTIYAGAGNDSVNGANGTDVAYDAESVTGATSLKSGTTTPTTPTTGGGTGSTGGGATGATNPPSNGNYGTPVARITSPTGLSVMTGNGVHVDALTSTLNGGQPTTARFEWDFGDSGSRFNKLVGFNAGHVYDRSGSYTITLKVINEGGKTSVTTTNVTVTTDTRQQIYVSSSGNDSNAGNASSPVKSFDRAVQLVEWANNAELLFRAGDTFYVDGTTMNLHGNNILVGTYGSGKAVLKYNGPRDAWRPIISVNTSANDVTIQNITFDSVYTSAGDTINMPVGIWTDGNNTVSRNNNFIDVGYGHDIRPHSVGTLVQDDTETKVTGMRDYFMWVEGTNVVAVGNTVVNSTRQHIIRMVGASRVLVSGNNLSNLDRRNVDAGDDAKGTIVGQKGQYYYVTGNKLTGPNGFGPLGKVDGMNDKSGRTNYSVFEANYVTGSFEIRHGSQHVMVRNNIFKQEGEDAAVSVEGYSSNYGRGSLDISILNNTAINNDTSGKFIQSAMPVEGMKVINNLYVAPNLATGPAGAAPFAVLGSDLSSFTKIDGNNWGSPTLAWFTDYGINSIGSWGDSSMGVWQTPAEWNSYAQVGTDQFVDVKLDGSFEPLAGQSGTGAVTTTGVLTDYYGNYRPSSGWTVGAVQA